MKDKLIILGTLIFLVILVGVYLYLGTVTLDVTTYKIKSENIPLQFDKFKIIQISDLHNEKNIKITKKMIEKIKEEEPNIIVLTGDIIDSINTDIDTSINFINEIKDVAKIYYVSGNHEAMVDAKVYDEFLNKMKNINVTILDNKVEEIEIDNAKINLMGVNDPRMYDTQYDDAIMKKNLESITYNKNNYTILLSHRPELFDIYHDNNIDLVLAGHTHGGGIRIPIFGGVIAPNQGLFPHFDAGKFTDDDTVMIISRKKKKSRVPIRINNNPELVEVILKHKETKKASD